MRRCLCNASLIVLAMLSVKPEPGVGDTLSRKVDRYLAPYLQGNNFTGVVLIARGDRVLVNTAYGLANRSWRIANMPGTRFHIASVSKPFTAAAILVLEERGLLRTRDQVSKYVPDFPHADEITLLHLLTHTSGIPNVNDMPEYETAQRLPQTPRSLIALFKNEPLHFPPGTKYEYSNSNYILLAYIIEAVSRKAYGEFLRENIFSPLGLADAGHDGNAADVIARCASGYQPHGVTDLENAPYVDWSAKTGNGSLYSTASDVFRFIRAYAQGMLVKPETVMQVWTEKPGNNFGWFVRKSHGQLAVATNGRSPGFTASAEYYPAQKLTVVVLSNSYSPVSQSPIAEDLAAMALGQSVPPPAKIVPAPIGGAALEKLEGKYRFGHDFYRPNAEVQIRINDGQAELDWGQNFRSALIPVGEGEFVDRQFWARVRMSPDGSGFTYSTSGREFKAERVR